MRGLLPDADGYADCDGVKVFYEVFGEGNSPTVLLVHGWQIAPSAVWKFQVPFLAREFRVVTLDLPGAGRSDRPDDPAAYDLTRLGVWLQSVMDATSTDKAYFVGLSGGALASFMMAVGVPDRTLGVVLIGGPWVSPEAVARAQVAPVARGFGTFNDALDSDEGWAKLNRHYWERDWDGFQDFWWHQLFPEPHSTKAIEDGVRWGNEASRGALIASVQGLAGEDQGAAVLAALWNMAQLVACPSLVIQGSLEPFATPDMAAPFAERMGGEMLAIDGAGHVPNARDPVAVNLAIRDFVRRAASKTAPPRTFVRGAVRPRRALFVSSPIGLGHARRDAAIAAELRKLRPDLQVEWLAQHPVTEVLRERGETVHPASALLASESLHWESECAEHDLNAFQALRRMDEILVANFMTFHDVVASDAYDLVVADEGWDVDYFMHENPGLKRTAYAWLTDFVGFVPMTDGEASLTSDYNQEMVEQVARYPRLRDRSIYVGDADDLVTLPLGPGLPSIRDWTLGHFECAGYVGGLEPVDRDEARSAFGFADGETVCVVSVGGSGVGTHLLRKAVAAYPFAREALPSLRMVAVTGPRIDPGSIEAPDGVEVRGYVPGLHRMLAAADLALVQGGLTTCMELVAARRPFLYFPLANHFEQQVHVTHRLRRHGAGRRLDYAASTPESIAQAMSDEAGRDCSNYLPVADGAARAAAMIAELV